jgi:para-aminobenzoate synthetase component 1
MTIGDSAVKECIHEMNRLAIAGIPFAFLIDFELQKPKVWRMDQSSEEFLFSFNGYSNHEEFVQSTLLPFSFEKSPIDIAQYARKFQKTFQHIRKGDSYLVNLTTNTQVKTDMEIDEMYARSHSKYKCLLKGSFVCFSPECFIRIEQNTICAFPMKGTINADIPNAREQILKNEKESAEHATIVDLIRNDLSMVASDVHVSRYRYYEIIRTNDRLIGQVSSEIKGNLDSGFEKNIGDIIFSQLPAGSVSGAPKKKTLEIIREVEGIERGYYTGISGYFAEGVLDSCVLIRFIDENGNYRSGGGITSRSEVNTEYQEMIDKVYVPVY